MDGWCYLCSQDVWWGIGGECVPLQRCSNLHVVFKGQSVSRLVYVVGPWVVHPHACHVVHLLLNWSHSSGISPVDGVRNLVPCCVNLLCAVVPEGGDRGSRCSDAGYVIWVVVVLCCLVLILDWCYHFSGSGRLIGVLEGKVVGSVCCLLSQLLHKLPFS